jgi:hypothetical protein
VEVGEACGDVVEHLVVREVSMPQRTYTGSDLRELLPESLRGFLVIDGLPLPEPIYQQVAAALEAAVNAITPVVRVRRRFYMVFATTPFKINLSNSELTLTLKPDALHIHMEDMIFIDVNKLLDVEHEHRVACILEELCHAMLSIDDEELVSIVVAHLYEGVIWKDGMYYIRR